MKHIHAGAFLIIGILLYTISVQQAYATILDKSFGGKVLLTPIPGVACKGVGKLLYMSSNISSAVDGVSSGVSGNSDLEPYLGKAGGRYAGVVSGIYGLIPTYATRTDKKPTPGGQILGLENYIPDFKTCYIGDVPIPILKTKNNYNVSKAKGK